MKTRYLSKFFIVFFLGLVGFTLSVDHTASGLWISQSPQELFEGSDTIFVGNITSVNVLQIEKQSSYTMEENGVDKNIIENYTVNLDEYKVTVKEFLKNPQNSNKITVRQPTIPGFNRVSAFDGFKTGDRVLFYVKNVGGINEYSPESFMIPKSCMGKDVLTQKRLEMGGELITIQNGNKVDYGNFTANKPIQFIYNKDVETLSGKSFDLLVYMTKTVGNSSEIVFNKEIHVESKPCEWVASAEWEFTPQEGDYGMDTRIKESDVISDQSDTGFSVKSDVTTHNSTSPLLNSTKTDDTVYPLGPDFGLLSPLKQFKSGIKPSDTTCQIGLQPVIKSEDNSPACIKPSTALVLAERGWGLLIPSALQKNMPILSHSMMVPNTNFTINYNIEGAKILGIKQDAPSKAIILSLETTSNGTLTLTVPRALLDIQKNNRGEGSFGVLEDGQEASFAQIGITPMDRTFSISIKSGTHEMEIFITMLV